MDQGAITIPIDEGMSRDVPPARKGTDPPSCVHVVVDDGGAGESHPQRGHRPSWADSYANYLYDDSVAVTSVHEDDDGETCLKSMVTMDTRRSLATMDTRTFRRIREMRREARFGGSKGSSKNSSRDDTSKRKGGDAAGTSYGRRGGHRSSRRSSATTASSRRAGSDCSRSSTLSSISFGTDSTASSRASDRSDASSVEGAKGAGSGPRRVIPLAASLLISLGLVVTRTGMDLVWLTTKTDRPGSLGAGKRRLQSDALVGGQEDWRSTHYEGFFTPRHDEVDDERDHRILLPENDDEFNKLRAQIRGAYQQHIASSEKYFGQALEKLREQQLQEPANRSDQERQEVAQQQAQQQTEDEDDDEDQELDLWGHVQSKGAGDIDLLSEDPFGSESRHLRWGLPVHLARSSLFADEERAEPADEEVDTKPEPPEAMNQANALTEEDPYPKETVDVMTLGYERMKLLYNI